MELDRALDELNSGRLPLLTDFEIRSLVRLAMDVRDARKELSPERRAALRAQVLHNVDRGFTASLRERVGALAALLARPLPPLSRSGAIAVMLIGLVTGASVASAESLPDDPLYGLKLDSEQLRLSLATNLADRAAVELGIAETRLREASALAAQDRDAEADAAASSYGEYLANAVASLEESASTSSDLVAQLRFRVVEQGDQLREAGAGGASAVTVLASVTREIAAAGADATTIADAAARAAEQAASMAKRRADEISAAPQTRIATQPASTPSDARSATGTMSAEQRAKVQAAAKAAKDAAERARAAAERAKKAAAEKAKRRVHDDALNSGDDR